MIAIIIPAHNEAGVIQRCLRSLTDALVNDDGPRFEIVVASNGCGDNTAELARAVEGVRVVETEMASKSHALNLGEKALANMLTSELSKNRVGEIAVRFYLDADVVVSAQAVREVASVMHRSPGILAASPMIDFDLKNCAWGVRAFYEVWRELPYCKVAMIGSGMYALSAEGRKRFGEFPDITADDAFVRLHFKPEERVTVETCRFVVTPPRKLGGVIGIKTRAHFGDLELAARYPELLRNKKDSHGWALFGLLLNPRWWIKVAVYSYVRTLSRILGRCRFHFGDHRKWERDESSRGNLAKAGSPDETISGAIRS